MKRTCLAFWLACLAALTFETASLAGGMESGSTSRWFIVAGWVLQRWPRRLLRR